MPQTSASSLLLVIEDNPTQLETLIDILEADGLTPIGCLSGKDALDACRRHDAHVALLDLRLPDMDGLTVLQQLKERIPDIMVIINTAYASLESAIEAVNCDAFAYVQKMGDPDELLGHVHRAFHAHLAGYSERLERDARQRTAELVQANAALQQEVEHRKQAEEQLSVSLAGKDVLLRELYHRTKNTLQVIRSMLRLQAARTPMNADVQKLVQDTENRILAISLVHQKLYQSQDLSRIDAQDYLSELSQLVMTGEAFSAGHVTLVSDIAPISMLLDTAIPCGLIVNELLSNALKHAFPDERRGEISVRLFRNQAGLLELHVADNGVGVPDGCDLRRQESLGIQSIVAIAEHQMQGQVTFRGEHGLACRVEFPDTLYMERV